MPCSAGGCYTTIQCGRAVATSLGKEIDFPFIYDHFFFLRLNRLLLGAEIFHLPPRRTSPGKDRCVHGLQIMAKDVVLLDIIPHIPPFPSLPLNFFRLGFLPPLLSSAGESFDSWLVPRE